MVIFHGKMLVHQRVVPASKIRSRLGLVELLSSAPAVFELALPHQGIGQPNKKTTMWAPPVVFVGL